MRESEIIKAGVQYTMSNHIAMIGGDAFADYMYEFNRNKAFEEGAKWADNHPKEGMVSLDKVCEWLKNELFEDPAEPNPYYLSDVKSKTYDYLDDFIQNFREEMGGDNI